MSPDELRARRVSLSLTQAGLGEAIGVTRGEISRWECGLVRITARRARWLDQQLARIANDSHRAQDEPREEHGPMASRFIVIDMAGQPVLVNVDQIALVTVVDEGTTRIWLETWSTQGINDEPLAPRGIAIDTAESFESVASRLNSK